MEGFAGSRAKMTYFLLRWAHYLGQQIVEKWQMLGRSSCGPQYCGGGLWGDLFGCQSLSV
jgi:hypothetical protein